MIKIEDIFNKLNELQEEVKKLKESQENQIVEKDWRDTDDSIVLKGADNEWIEVESNFNTWRRSKDENHPLLIDVYENENRSCCTAISLEEMIKLRDYLNEKIEFLQE